MLSIDKKDLNLLYASIAKSYKLYAPIKKANQTNFAVWDENAKVDLETLKTVKSAKEVFFPQCEDIVSFKREGKKITIENPELSNEDFVVFGVRGCDAKSFDILDKVFLSEPVDTFYKTRREHGTVVTLACSRPSETCFCKVFGIDAANPAQDAQAYFVGEKLYIEPLTEKGKTLLEKIKTVLNETEDTLVVEEKSRIKEIIDKLPLSNLDISDWGGDDLLEKFNSPLWQELSESCLGCGACTFVCPTCQCYDIKDFDKGNGIQRYRCWDSCMYKDFTMMAHGTPRPTQMQRFRQRFMHKLVYFPSNNNGEFSCVGCGRCLDKCPMHINIVKVIKTFGGKK